MWHWIHEWSQWSNIVRQHADKVEEGVFKYDLVQMRTCKRCNYQELHTL